MGSARGRHMAAVAESKTVEPAPVARPDAARADAAAVMALESAGLMPTLDDLEQRLDAALAGGPRTLVLDMSAVARVSSTTVAALLWARRRCSARGVEVVLRNPSRRCLAAMRRAGLLTAVATERTDLPRVPDDRGLARGPLATQRERHTPSTGLETGVGAGDPPPGVTRFDVVCRPDAVETTLALTRRWAADRALPDLAWARLAVVLRAAMAHGLRFDPRGVTLLVRWLDLDRVRLELRWRQCASTASPGAGADAVEDTTWLLDTIADDWGVGRSGGSWVQWIVVDTR